ncbi:MAG: AarF/ABC1/UbiB kinase family protein [Desulfobacterales bacterium]|nr:AarF/ABC1/UbiB kinase family protein [Desulfobacterales bacterium]
MLSIRKIGVLGRTYRHLNRYRQILGVLFKYGFGDLVDRLRIEQYLEIGLQVISRKKRERVERLTRAVRVRMAFEELGPTFIKLAQVLSARPDLIPPDLVAELARLQDKVPATGFAALKEIFRAELQKSPEEIFEHIEQTPLASASIAQVHRAVLKDGEEVAVKIQRPGIRKVIEVDLEIMLHLATLMERHIEEFSLHRPVKIVEEFTRTIEKELDFVLEAENMERFAAQFLMDEHFYVPKTFREFSSSRVLTMEFIQGVKVSEVDKLDAAGLDRKIIVDRGAEFLLRQIFENGFFHADPHPGNIFVLPGNVICMLDYGMVGSIVLQTRERFVDLISAVVRRDSSRAVQVLLRLTEWEEEPDLRRFEREVDDFMGRHLYRSLKNIQIGALLQELLQIAARYRLRIPSDTFMMMKALAVIEGVARMLDPDFEMVAKAAPFVEKVRLERFSPKRISEDAYRMGADFLIFLQQFPKDALEIFRLIRQRKLTVNLEHQGLANMLATHDQISNRVSFSIIIAGLIVGSALIVISEIPPLFYGISLIGIIGFLAAALMGIWLLVAILRKGSL